MRISSGRLSTSFNPSLYLRSRRKTSARPPAILSFCSLVMGIDFRASNAFSATLKSPFSAIANLDLISNGPNAVGFTASARSMVLLAASKFRSI